MTTCLVTGGAGFIGHHLIEHLFLNTDFNIVCLDKLTYASNGYNRLRDAGCMDSPRIRTFAVDFSHPISPGILEEIKDVNYVFHLGAETHVDNSITDPGIFVQANVVGTYYILEFCRKLEDLKTFFYFSTDEVFGPAPEGVSYKEDDRYDATNPYSATKAGGEQIALSFANTYGLPVNITRTMNCFGERQHPEKFIPLVINKILNKERVYIHSYPDREKAGSRSYIHCRNVSAALLFLMQKVPYKNREIYHITGEQEVNNFTMAITIAKILEKKLEYELVDFHSSRPGHDLRYALDGSKMKTLGWELPKTFEESLEKTVKWYLENPNWLNWEGIK